MKDFFIGSIITILFLLTFPIWLPFALLYASIVVLKDIGKEFREIFNG